MSPKDAEEQIGRMLELARYSLTDAANWAGAQAIAATILSALTEAQGFADANRREVWRLQGKLGDKLKSDSKIAHKIEADAQRDLLARVREIVEGLNFTRYGGMRLLSVTSLCAKLDALLDPPSAVSDQPAQETP